LGGGNDTYVYSRGDGSDTIVEGSFAGSNDQLILADINPNEVTLVRNGNDPTLVILPSSPGGSDGGSILLKNNLNDYFDQGVEKIAFADGTQWTRSDLRAMILANASTPGNDSIVGFSASETLSGGRGNDLLNGDGGDDVYLYARGEGQDTITEGMVKGVNDRLVLNDINPADVSLQRSGNDVKLVIADGGSILLKNNLDDYFDQGVDQIAFADGMEWTCAPWCWPMPARLATIRSSGSACRRHWLAAEATIC
jgi:Ca2+-binding RTX toxin-like protein